MHSKSVVSWQGVAGRERRSILRLRTDLFLFASIGLGSCILRPWNPTVQQNGKPSIWLMPRFYLRCTPKRKLVNPSPNHLANASM